MQSLPNEVLENISYYLPSKEYLQLRIAMPRFKLPLPQRMCFSCYYNELHTQLSPILSRFNLEDDQDFIKSLHVPDMHKKIILKPCDIDSSFPSLICEFRQWSQTITAIAHMDHINHNSFLEIFHMGLYNVIPIVVLRAIYTRIIHDVNYEDGLPFMVFVASGDVETVSQLLHSPFVDPCRNNNEVVVLACKQGHLEILKLLLKDGRIDQSANGDECFIEACANGHVDVMNFLLLNGANAAALDNSAIQLASENGHVKAVKMLLCLPEVFPGSNNNEALIQATKNGHSEVVDLLLESNKVLPSDRNNNSLFLAAQSGNMAICKSLLRDSTVREHHGITEIIQIAYQKNHFKIVTLLVQSVRISVHSLKALKKLAMHDGINELIEPLESRIPSNITQIHHAFTIACVKGYLDIVTELYYEIKVAHLHSCFIEAVTAGQTRIVQFLLQDKIINAAYSNNLALRRACANGFHEIVELLFTHPSVYNSDINAALTIACRNGHVKVVEFLVAYTDPSIHDNEALKISIEYADVSITNFLLKKERIQSRLSS